MKFENRFDFIPTTICNFRCAHCYGDYTDKGLTMTLDEGRKAIIEISKAPVDGIRIIRFLGGECTILMDSFLYYLKLASSLGIRTYLITNAWWGDMAEEYVGELKNAGLSHISISCDVFHLEFNPWSSI